MDLGKLLGALDSAGAALTKLGDHLAEAGGEARGYLHS
jgi:hypothetical protein